MYAVKACRSCCHRFHVHLLSHMLWGFLLQLMRANSRQLLSYAKSDESETLSSANLHKKPKRSKKKSVKIVVKKTKKARL